MTRRLLVIGSACALAGCAGFLPPREVAGPPAPVPGWVFGTWVSTSTWGFNSTVGQQFDSNRLELDPDSGNGGRFRSFRNAQPTGVGTFVGEGVPDDPGAVRLRFTGKSLENYGTVDSFGEWEWVRVVRYDEPDSLTALGNRVD